MGIDVYSYVEQDSTLVDVCDLPGIDWREVLGHPLKIDWGKSVWQPGEKLQPWDIGYLHESYHGLVHPVKVLMPESFDRGSYETFGKPDDDGDYEHSGVHIPLRTLKARLPETLEVARERFAGYRKDPAKAEDWWGYQQYIDLVKVHEYLARGDLRCLVYNSY